MSRAPVTVVGYGSLMSASGIARHGNLPLNRAEPVELRNARRGFGKASIHADRFAMVLEPSQRGRAITATATCAAPGDSSIHALALEVSAHDLPALAKREGYSSRACEKLQSIAADAGLDVAGYLAALLWECGGDTAHYRERLCRRLEYTSPHYIPHPVMIDTEAAIVFLAPGREGTGSDAVASVRVQTGVTELMTVAEVWRRKPTDSQLEYVVSCLLGEAHGLQLGDIRSDIPADLEPQLAPAALDFEGERRRLGGLKRAIPR